MATTDKREFNRPTYSFGDTVRGAVGPVDRGITAQRTDPCYYNDENLPVTIGGTEVYPAKIPAYTLVTSMPGSTSSRLA